MSDNLFRIPVGTWAETGLDWITANFEPFFDVLKTAFQNFYDALAWVLTAPPFWAVILVLALLAWLVKSWKLGLGTVIGLVAIYGMNQWENSMETLALVLVASLIAVVISIPLGVLTAKSKIVSAVVKPILDFLQTMPAFVYLIPAILLLGIGAVPGIVATIVFSLAPGARFTELGIRSVDTEVLEAGQAFGASPGRILRQIQFPLALPTIMAGINQVIMLSLSMVVIAGMVGAGGLGAAVYKALTTLNTPLGVESGLSVVVLAIVLDRITASFGQSNVPSKNA
ncbi:ABC transporter permease [Arthrobacter rhombi]|uniref:L-proline glycine betaine ABC transport system permease protein ProW (TC 3.A.1.12.1) n=1 Tax=Arthrobacter rhombi TaxID=71253 RepID=A0A1R4ETP8_9MICC|nr:MULTISPECIES: proline/glycine betaine ABC transporter permease [Micrococcaceae]PCC24493.1 glycine/betaine ABC transporter [Glutamicibacter sp. BW78]SJM47028.1 L-proline glycine betaine ABC transport system permease protein ProW (TC 3.A.1.12.1) [Arthrobacter rhombi]